MNRQRPHLGDAGQGVNRKQDLLAYMQALSHRLRRVRVCCGDWSRVCGPTPTYKHGLTGVFLDPPYSSEAGRDMGCYSIDSGTVAHEVRAWCVENGSNPLMRIALCGYEGERHEELEALGWSVEAWKAHGGYGSQGNGKGRENSGRERIWFSPACLSRVQGSLW